MHSLMCDGWTTVPCICSMHDLMCNGWTTYRVSVIKNTKNTKNTGTKDRKELPVQFTVCT